MNEQEAIRMVRLIRKLREPNTYYDQAKFAHCALGWTRWIPESAAEGFKLADPDSRLRDGYLPVKDYPEYDGKYGIEAGRVFYGLTYAQAEQLFGSPLMTRLNYPELGYRDPRDPEVAARAFEETLESYGYSHLLAA